MHRKKNAVKKVTGVKDLEDKCRNVFNLTYRERIFLEEYSEMQQISHTGVMSLSLKILRILDAVGVIQWRKDGTAIFHYIPGKVSGYEQFSDMVGLKDGDDLVRMRVKGGKGQGSGRVDMVWTEKAKTIIKGSNDEFDL